MGFAIAEEFANQGADVVLITGPTSEVLDKGPAYQLIRRIDVTTAEEMRKTCMHYFEKSFITVMAAAVADYKPAQAYGQKIKKKNAGLVLELLPTVDILAELGKKKKGKQILVGFALETTDGLNYAKEKLKKKNLDLIILNSLQDKGAGFKGDTNKVTFVDRNNKTSKFELKDKKEVAIDIVNKVLTIVKF
jgi:phosphopantothenoylcysteine decarboxylase/phosphopantothenate--cysteine ligase